MGAVDSAALKQAVQRWAPLVLGDAGLRIPDQIRPYAPIGKPTSRNDGYTPGALRESIRLSGGQAQIGADSFGIRVVADVIQAKTTDQGAPPHIIRARRVGGLLVFEVGGETVFTSKPVNHPGNAARPWWNRALEATWGPNLRYAALHVPFG